MITIQKLENTRILPDEERITGEFAGLSTDAKPTIWSEKNVDNGSTFIEIDTGKIYKYDLQNKRWIVQDGGGSGGNIQPSKSVEYTSNDTYVVEPDDGYDGIAKVNVDVNVPSVVNNEDIEETITSNNTYTYTPSSGYTGIGSITVDVNVPSSGGGIDLTDGYGFAYSSFASLPTNLVNANWDEITSMNYKFYHCESLTSIANIDTSNIISMPWAFAECGVLTTFPSLDTSSVQYMDYMLAYDYALTNVPVLDVSSLVTMDNMFESCPNLSNQSLDNIMEMCIDTTANYVRPKTLKQIGVMKTLAETCKTLDNYNDFVSAGWETGYEKQIEVDIPAIITLGGTGTNYILTGEYDILDGYLEGYGVDLILNDSINSETIKGGIEYTSFRSFDSALTFDIEYNWVQVDDEQHKEYYFSNIQYNSNGTELEVDLTTIESEPARYDYNGLVDLQYVLIPTSNYRLTLTDNNLGTSLSGTATCGTNTTLWDSDDGTLSLEIAYDDINDKWYFENITYTPQS